MLSVARRQSMGVGSFVSGVVGRSLFRLATTRRSLRQPLGRPLRVGRCRSIPVNLCLCVGCCELVAVGRLVALCSALWVGRSVDWSTQVCCCGLVAVGWSLWVSPYAAMPEKKPSLKSGLHAQQMGI